MSTSTSEATSDYSTGNRRSKAPTERPGRTRLALSGLAIVAGVVLALSSFLTLFRITTGEVAIRTYSGFDQHSIAMLLLAVAVVPMALGALRGARVSNMTSWKAFAACVSGALSMAVGACSLLLDTSAQQCNVDGDCAKRSRRLRVREGCQYRQRVAWSVGSGIARK